ncbi:hypothetical protein D3C86_1123650 [compost metagenome]
MVLALAPALDGGERSKGHERPGGDGGDLEGNDGPRGEGLGVQGAQGPLVLPRVHGDQRVGPGIEALLGKGGFGGLDVLGPLGSEQIGRRLALGGRHATAVLPDGHQPHERLGPPLGRVRDDLVGGQSHLDLGARVQGVPIHHPLLEEGQGAEGGVARLPRVGVAQRVLGAEGRGFGCEGPPALGGAGERQGVVGGAVRELLRKAREAVRVARLAQDRPDQREEAFGGVDDRWARRGLVRDGACQVEAPEAQPTCERRFDPLRVVQRDDKARVRLEANPRGRHQLLAHQGLKQALQDSPAPGGHLREERGHERGAVGA